MKATDQIQTKCVKFEVEENMCEQDMIGFGFTSDWLRKWLKFFQLITKY